MSTEVWQQRAERVIPGGVSSNVRLLSPRRFFTHGSGARLWDVDGRAYVDYLLGQGPAFLGHGHPVVTAAVAEAVAKGMVYGAQHPLEVEAAERFVEAVGWAEQVRFGVSGTESDHAALRLARAVTGRRRVVRFAGTYHGWLDSVLIDYQRGWPAPASAGQPTDALADWLVVPYNDPTTLADVFDRYPDQIAAVILEPVMCNAGVIPAEDGFLQFVRETCTTAGAVLIFDEVITGFRLGLGGAAEYYGVTPDLAVYGKALAGGWPVSALAGSADLMSELGTGRVNHSGTFNASVMAAAAVSATLQVLTEDPPYARISEHGTRLMRDLAELGDNHGFPLRIQGVPAAFHVGIALDPDDTKPITDYDGLARLDLQQYAKLTADFAEQGLWVAGRGVWYVSAAHTDADADAAVTAVDAVLRSKS
ncbi:glutamate-1-semialdehyde 2,1-aminomutase [Kribbella hippodromi]|uniref:Glutamate-1-semialdehyde 2,1-aminomutase n=1 Tax=Kribbella hippodromi TaxID=434347 RepID=A0ABN2EGE4_9ACTN